MINAQEFAGTVEALVGRYPESSLAERWEDARYIDPNPSPAASWIRESADLVNVTWFNSQSIIDITWFPQRGLSTLNYLPLSSVAGFEIRHGPNVADELGYSISGVLAVRIFASAGQAGVIWIAPDDQQSIRNLRDFIRSLLAAIHST